MTPPSSPDRFPSDRAPTRAPEPIPEPVPENFPELTGVLANRYRIDGTIGAGGMATVYRARDLQHDTTVAIKAPRPELVMQLGVERFAREVKISAQLQHPNIVPVFDSGTADGIPFYVMPFIEGETLEARLKREGALPIPEAIAIACQVLDGLAFAHRNGFVHRDVKPANVLLSHGHALLADFGIARAMEKADATKLTESGFAIGTVDYMSPEQASASAQVDGRSDQYSLACVLYEMLSGQPPFAGSTARSVMARHLIDPPPSLRTVRATVSSRLEQALMTALAKHPADRFATAADFRDALKDPAILVSDPTGSVASASSARVAAASGGTAASTGAPPAVSSGSRRWGVIAAGTLAIVAAAVAVWRLASPTGDALDARRIMVYPFVVPEDFTGSRSSGEDVATLIGNALDGTGALRWVDGWALLDENRRRDIRALTLEGARDLARGKRCATFITGRLVALGDSSRVIVTLHDVRGDSVLSEGAATGAAADAWRQGLKAVNGVLPALIPDGATTVSAAWTDRNPTAIASFLLGEGAFRRLHLEEALDQFRRAVQTDSTFAVAAIRGAQVAAWNHRPGEARTLLQLALAQPLAPRDAEFARGFAAYLAHDADSAATHLRAAIAADPEMGVAWLQLGEVYSHLVPFAGSPDSLADLAFTEARHLDSAAANLLFHPIQIRLRRGDVPGATALLSRFLATTPDTVLAGELALAESCVRTGGTSMDWRGAAAARPLLVLFAGNMLGGLGARYRCAQDAFAAILAVDTAATPAADGRRWSSLVGLTAAHVAHGRPDLAAAAIDGALARWGFGSSLFVLAAPIVPEFRARAQAVATADEQRFGPNYLGAPLPYRLWQLGVLEARLGRREVAAAVASELSRRATEHRSRYEAGLARSLEAFVTLAGGDTTEAIRRFSRVIADAAIGDTLQWDEAEPRGGERLVLAELLFARGELQRAIDVANVFDSSWPAIHVLYLPASLELRLRAAEALGNAALASHFRARLTALRGDDGSSRR